MYLQTCKRTRVWGTSWIPDTGLDIFKIVHGTDSRSKVLHLQKSLSIENTFISSNLLTTPLAKHDIDMPTSKIPDSWFEP